MRTVKASRLHRFTCCGVAALTLGLTAGCEGGQTGDLSGQNDGSGQETSGDGGCDEHKKKLADFDETTDFGSANDLLAYAESSFEAPISWKSAPEGQSWSVGPESDQGRIHVDVARGESAYLLTYTPHQSSSGAEGGAALGVLCPPPQLGVEAHVNVSTDGGALAESYDTLLRSSTPGLARISLPFDPAKVQGSLEITSSDPHAKLVQLSLEAELTAQGMMGSLAGLEQVQSDGPNGAASAQGAVLALWPDTDACSDVFPGQPGLEVAPADEVLGVTGDDSLSSLVPEDAPSITWLDGSETTLELGVASEGDGCFSARSDLPVELGGGPAVSYPVTITLKSDDGRLDGSYTGRVLATGSGDTRRVAAEVGLNLALDEVDQSGFSSVSVPDGAESLVLRIEVAYADGSASGSVRLVALTGPDCSQTPPPEPSPGGGASAPGCAGQTQEPVETATWGN